MNGTLIEAGWEGSSMMMNSLARRLYIRQLHLEEALAQRECRHFVRCLSPFALRFAQILTLSRTESSTTFSITTN